MAEIFLPGHLPWHVLVLAPLLQELREKYLTAKGVRSPKSLETAALDVCTRRVYRRLPVYKEGSEVKSKKCVKSSREVRVVKSSREVWSWSLG